MNIERSAVVGNPVSHSLSPVIFNYIYKTYNIQNYYSRIHSDNFDEAKYLIENLNINFFNVTAPFKNDGFNYCSKIDEFSKFSNTCNFIRRESDNIVGFNTDLYALKQILEVHNFSNAHRVLIIGSGDTGKMAYKFLKYLNYSRVKVLVRSKQKAISSNYFSESNIIEFTSLLSLKTFDLIINTIPESDFDLQSIWDNPSISVIDAIYHKPFLDKFECNYISGLQWLAFQAIPIIKYNFGIEVNINELLQLLQINKKNKFVLTGFMGSGKSTIGKLFAEKLKMKYGDSDTEIENYSGMNISNIIKKYGVNYFRELEQKVIIGLINSDFDLISLGGGSLLNQNLADQITQKYFNIWLYSDLKDIKLRIENDLDKRPLFNNDNFENLYFERENSYFSNSDLVIYNSKNLEDIQKKVINEIRFSF